MRSTSVSFSRRPVVGAYGVTDVSGVLVDSGVPDGSFGGLNKTRNVALRTSRLRTDWTLLPLRPGR